MIGSETNLTKTRAYDRFGRIEETPNGANIALHVYRPIDPHDPRPECEPVAFVLLTKTEARDLVGQLLTLIH